MVKLRQLSILLTLASFALLVACAGENDEPEAGGTESTADERVVPDDPALLLQYALDGLASSSYHVESETNNTVTFEEDTFELPSFQSFDFEPPDRAEGVFGLYVPEYESNIESEIIWIGDVQYMYEPEIGWGISDFPVESPFSNRLNIGAYVVDDLDALTLVGEETLAGEEVQHLQAVASALSGLVEDGEFTIDYWIGEDGMLRKVRLAGVVAVLYGDEEEIPLHTESVMLYSDFGADYQIEEPEIGRTDARYLEPGRMVVGQLPQAGERNAYLFAVDEIRPQMFIVSLSADFDQVQLSVSGDHANRYGVLAMGVGGSGPNYLSFMPETVGDHVIEFIGESHEKSAGAEFELTWATDSFLSLVGEVPEGDEQAVTVCIPAGEPLTVLVEPECCYLDPVLILRAADGESLTEGDIDDVWFGGPEQHTLAAAEEDRTVVVAVAGSERGKAGEYRGYTLWILTEGVEEGACR